MASSGGSFAASGKWGTRPSGRQPLPHHCRSCCRSPISTISTMSGTALPPADLVILPGSKATIADLAVFRAEGWDIDLAAHRRRGGEIGRAELVVPGYQSARRVDGFLRAVTCGCEIECPF